MKLHVICTKFSQNVPSIHWFYIHKILSAADDYSLIITYTSSFPCHSSWGKLYIFDSGEIMHFEVVDGGLICSSGVHVEEMGDKTDECYIVNAAVYVGY